VAVLSVGAAGRGADWPQWRGPSRDGRSPETGLLKVWPDGGPTQAWVRKGVGAGFGSVAVADALIYVAGMVRGVGRLAAINLAGRCLWTQPYGPEWARGFPGGRTTPTVHDGRVYVMAGLGRLTCFDATTGATRWSVEAMARFNGRLPEWGFAESVLVVGPNVICTPGGPDASVVALDRKTGQLVWQSKGLSQRSAYCSPIAVQRGDRRLIVTMVYDYIVGLDAADGHVLWRHKHHTKFDVHPVTPLHIDGHVYAVSGYGAGGVLLRLSDHGARVTRVWADTTLDNHHGGVVLVDGRIYGSNYRNRWVCLDARTGRTVWQGHSVRKGSVVYADGMLYCYGEGGHVALARPTPDGLDVVSRFRVTEGRREHWAHPAIAGARLYIRHGDALVAYDIKGDRPKPPGGQAPSVPGPR